MCYIRVDSDAFHFGFNPFVVPFQIKVYICFFKGLLLIVAGNQSETSAGSGPGTSAGSNPGTSAGSKPWGRGQARVVGRETMSLSHSRRCLERRKCDDKKSRFDSMIGEYLLN